MEPAETQEADNLPAIQSRPNSSRRASIGYAMQRRRSSIKVSSPRMGSIVSPATNLSRDLNSRLITLATNESAPTLKISNKRKDSTNYHPAKLASLGISHRTVI
jgi:hypothetical protein